MTKFKKENVYEILKKYDFNIENEIGSDLLCLLCKRLLINAQISPCACRFCFNCISKYLNKEEKPCPGNTDDCKNELLCLNENILVDYAINNKISKLIVKCPQKSCEYKCELRNIEEHIRICNYRSMCCPYLNIGCNSSNMHAGNVIDHLQLEIINHTKLLIDCIDNLNNEIGRLKMNVDKLGEENKMLKCEINEIKLDGEKKQMKCDEQMREIDLLNEDMVALRNVDKYTRDDVDELKLDGKRNKKSIETLEKKCEEKNKEQIEQLNKKYQEIENKFVNENQERENKEKDLMKNEIDEIRNKQIEMRTMSNRIDQTMKNVENKLLEIEINQNKMNYGEFVWRIDEINDKMKDAKNGINTRIYSDSFYTHKHGYKMCLQVFPDGFGDGKGTHLSVYFHLMKGEFDDILQWPFKYAVTFSLVNQQSRLDFGRFTAKYDDLPNSESFNKPINERNGGFGRPKFIELQELSTNANLTRNNQIFIKCSVNISS